MISKSEIGGAQYWVANFISSLNLEKFEIILITDRPGWLCEKVSHLEVGTIFVEDLDKISFGNFAKVYKALKLINADCLITNSAFAGFYGRICGYLLGISSVYVSHGWSAIYTKSRVAFIYKLLETVLAWLTKEIWCVSQADLDKAQSRLHIRHNKLRHVKLKIPDASFDDEVPDNKTCLFVARFCQPKRGDILIKAINEINYHLVVYGDGALKDEWSKLDRNDLVDFKGFIETVPYSKRLGIFVLISDSEGLPVSAVEAMRAGMPLILSNVGGCAELIDDNGYIVDNSVEGVARALEATNVKYQMFSQKSRANFVKNHSIDNDPSYYQDLVLNTINGTK